MRLPHASSSSKARCTNPTSPVRPQRRSSRCWLGRPAGTTRRTAGRWQRRRLGTRRPRRRGSTDANCRRAAGLPSRRQREGLHATAAATPHLFQPQEPPATSAFNPCDARPAAARSPSGSQSQGLNRIRCRCARSHGSAEPTSDEGPDQLGASRAPRVARPGGGWVGTHDVILHAQTGGGAYPQLR